MNKWVLWSDVGEISCSDTIVTCVCVLVLQPRDFLFRISISLNTHLHPVKVLTFAQWNKSYNIIPLQSHSMPSHCNYCDRYFANDRSVVQHWKNSSVHEWCERCEKVFNSASAKQQHLANSSNHHVCSQCPSNAPRPDFWSYSDLRVHLRRIHSFCVVCRELYGSAAGLRRHDIAVHNLCVICGQFFHTPQNLKAVCA